jgi:hypothetical protein
VGVFSRQNCEAQACLILKKEIEREKEGKREKDIEGEIEIKR